MTICEKQTKSVFPLPHGSYNSAYLHMLGKT